jgi:xylose isomerase
MNKSKLKYSVILNNYNKPSDRFLTSGYGAPASKRGVFELIELAGKQEVVQGLEMLMYDGADGGTGDGGTWIGVGPANKREIKAALHANGLKLATVIPNLWGDWSLAHGTLGARDPRVRSKSIDMVKRAMDLAADLDCEHVGLWPGHDGYDYYFEADYQQLWDLWVEGMQSIADHNPAIRVGLEAKPDEPRGYSLISTNPKTLLLLRDIDRENVGVVLDVGHSLYAHENLGEVVALTQANGRKLFHCHMNDNYNTADLDMIVGSIHTLEFIEMFYWLRRTGYEHWLSIDLFAYRTDPAQSIVEGIKWMQAFETFVEDACQAGLDDLIVSGEPIKNQRFLRDALFGRVPVVANS